MSDVTFDIQLNEMQVHQKHAEPWRVTLVDTGEGTLTGGRLKRIKKGVAYLRDDLRFSPNLKNFWHCIIKYEFKEER
jgi:glucose-1-phosphate cytidylyltransferase